MSLEHASCILYMAVGMMYAMLNETNNPIIHLCPVHSNVKLI